MAKGIVNGGLNGGGGSNIKSIQRGSHVLYNVIGQTITIGEVDLTKSIVKITVHADTISYAGPVNRAVKAKLISSTGLNFSVNSAAPVNTYIEWEVIEFNNVKSIQKGDVALSANALKSVTVSPIETSKSVLFISHTSSTTDGVGYLVSGKVTSPTNIDLRCMSVSNVYWQLIEFN